MAGLHFQDKGNSSETSRSVKVVQLLFITLLAAKLEILNVISAGKTIFVLLSFTHSPW